MTAGFWEQRYRQEHRTRHAMEDEIAALRERAAELEDTLRLFIDYFDEHTMHTHSPKAMCEKAHSVLSPRVSDT